MTNIAIVIPAAGSSSRMRGADKLLEPVAGIPLLRRVAERALGQSDTVFVTLAEAASPRAQALHGLAVRLIEVPDASEGMAASLRRAVVALPPETAGVMILPADMPDITTEDLAAVIAVFRDTGARSIVQATGADGTPGHPVIFPSDLIGSFRELAGDTGARSILKTHRNRLKRVELPDTHALVDLDTPEAWDQWRKSNPGR